MRKRSSRVYVLLAIISVIMIGSVITDITTNKTSNTMNQKKIETADSNNNSSDRTYDRDIEPVSEENSSVGNTTEAVSDRTTETSTKLTAEEIVKISQFYKNTVFVGDSIMSGFAVYTSTDAAPKFTKNLTFLAASSYGVDAALNGKTLIYKGQARTLVENLEIINPNKIFINLGVNELNGVSAKTVGEKYEKLINNIKKSVPKAEIYTLGVTYFVEGKETSTYNNDGIREYNEYIKSHSKNWGTNYLDLGKYLSNDKGYLPDEYASDGRIHHNEKAYGEWVKFLQNVALGKIKGE